jgi:hypothetical protein
VALEANAMSIKSIGRGSAVRTLLIGTGVLAAVAVAGCTGGQTATGQTSTPTGTTSQTVAGGPSTGSTSTTPPTSTASVPSTPSGSPTSPQSGAPGNTVAAAHSSSVPECKANMLALSFGGVGAGMSQQERVLRFTNISGQSCFTVGFPGVSYVTGDNGQQVGAPAVRTGKIRARVTLAPGAVASTVIHSVDPGVFDVNACKPTPVRGYRIYAPDDRAAMFIALPAGMQGCAGNPPDPQLSVVSIKPGLGDPSQP